MPLYKDALEKMGCMTEDYTKEHCRNLWLHCPALVEHAATFPCGTPQCWHTASLDHASGSQQEMKEAIGSAKFGTPLSVL
jgi:hypothetical protein